MTTTLKSQSEGEKLAEKVFQIVFFDIIMFFMGGLYLMVLTDWVLSIFDKPGLGYWASAVIFLFGRWTIRGLTISVADRDKD